MAQIGIGDLILIEQTTKCVLCVVTGIGYPELDEPDVFVTQRLDKMKNGREFLPTIVHPSDATLMLKGFASLSDEEKESGLVAVRIEAAARKPKKKDSMWSTRGSLDPTNRNFDPVAYHLMFAAND